jgi:histidinol-phosphate aminotransferase
MDSLLPIHGGTDAGVEPIHDFSSNANCLAPCRPVLDAVRAADVSRYPDPHYTRLRERLAAHHGTTAEHVVVGAGASELILRLIRHFAGAVQQIVPTFSEYARGAALSRRELVSVDSMPRFLEAQLRHPGLGFLCWPNNPTGVLHPLDFIEAAAATGPVVLDLAYAPLCELNMRDLERAASRAYRLYSPNKAFGLTGVRGAYLIAPRPEPDLIAQAPSWVIGRDAVAMLEAVTEPAALLWLAQALPRLHRWRRMLAASLGKLGLAVRESPASFVLTEVGSGSQVSQRLRERGIRVRDATSFGLPQWVRISAQRPRTQRALIDALRAVL